jgi:hypothetical protein
VIYLVMCQKPWTPTKRFECLGILATRAIALGYREEGYAVTVLAPVPEKKPS